MQAPSGGKLHPYPQRIFIFILVQNGGREPPTPLVGGKEGRKEGKKRGRECRCGGDEGTAEYDR